MNNDINFLRDAADELLRLAVLAPEIAEQLRQIAEELEAEAQRLGGGSPSLGGGQPR